jgi:hypothetical protein
VAGGSGRMVAKASKRKNLHLEHVETVLGLNENGRIVQNRKTAVPGQYVPTPHRKRFAKPNVTSQAERKAVVASAMALLSHSSSDVVSLKKTPLGDLFLFAMCCIEEEKKRKRQEESTSSSFQCASSPPPQTMSFRKENQEIQACHWRGCARSLLAPPGVLHMEMARAFSASVFRERFRELGTAVLLTESSAVFGRSAKYRRPSRKSVCIWSFVFPSTILLGVHVLVSLFGGEAFVAF